MMLRYAILCQYIYIQLCIDLYIYSRKNKSYTYVHIIIIIIIIVIVIIIYIYIAGPFRSYIKSSILPSCSDGHQGAGAWVGIGSGTGTLICLVGKFRCHGYRRLAKKGAFPSKFQSLTGQTKISLKGSGSRLLIRSSAPSRWTLVTVW